MILLPASDLGKLAQIFRSSAESDRSSEKFQVTGEEMMDLFGGHWTDASR
jgi:hypothetical protein